ncbi:MAG: hypothetical protein QN229_06930 [Desulfurococcaceae archaeon TW002]
MSSKTTINIASKLLEVAVKNGCMIKEDQLYTELRSEFGISYSEFIRLLMLLEMRGLIRVVLAKGNIKNILLSEVGRTQLGVQDKCVD